MAKIRSIPTKILNQRLTSTGTKLFLSDIDDWDGVDLTSSVVPALMYVTLRNSNRTQLEIIEVDGTTIADAITSTGATINKRALGYEGGTTTATETAYEWNDNETYVELCSDTPQILENMLDKDRAQTVTGVKTFSASPIAPTPTTATQVAIKSYVDGVALVSAPDMDLTTKGVGEEATAAEINAGTQTGGTSAQLVVNPKYLKDSIYYTQLPTADQKAALAGTTTPSASNLFITQSDLQKSDEIYSADAEASDTYAITTSPAIAAYATGMAFRVKFNTANTGAATINVDAKGAKNITKAGATALATGDILAAQVGTIVYDGTQFQLQGVSLYEAEAGAVFAATDITGAELETLSSGETSNADTKHTHSLGAIAKGSYNGDFLFIGSKDDGLTESIDTNGTITRNFMTTIIVGSGNTAGTKLWSAKFGGTEYDWDNKYTFYFSAIQTTKGADNRTGAGFWGLSDDTNTPPDSESTPTGAWIVRHAGFIRSHKANSGEYYVFASNADGSTQTKTDVSAGATFTNWNNFKIDFINTTGTIKYYINDVLVATHTTNIPTGDVTRIQFGGDTPYYTDTIQNNYQLVATR